MKTKKPSIDQIINVISSNKFGLITVVKLSLKNRIKHYFEKVHEEIDLINLIGKNQYNWNEYNYKKVAQLIKK